MEEVFHEKFIKLRLKIHKIIEGQYDDELMYEILVHSILIDCRAIFLENTDYKYNTTLQNIYRNRSLNEYADGIDMICQHFIGHKFFNLTNHFKT